MNPGYPPDLKNLAHAAANLERELAKRLQSHPLIFREKRALQSELDRILRIRQAKDAGGYSTVGDLEYEAADLIGECWIMIECATLIVHGF